MTTPNLQELRRVTEAATQEPVAVGRMVNADGIEPRTTAELVDCVRQSIEKSDQLDFLGVFIITDDDPCRWVCHTGNGPTSKANAEFYVQAKKLLPGLIDRLERAEEKAIAWENLAVLRDKYLVCYRTGRNPGALIDKVIAARKRVEDLTQ